jgi:uncharacterized protein (TIGR02246 family)
MTADEQQIRQLVADWMAAMRAGEVDRVLDLMTEDAIFLTPGSSPMTKADFAIASRAQALSGIALEGKNEIKEIQVCGDWAFMWSYLSVSIKPFDQGKPIERAGHTLSVFNKQNGHWLLARDANLLAPAKQ